MAAGPHDGAGKFHGKPKRPGHLVDNLQLGIGGCIDSIHNAYIGFSTSDEMDDVFVFAIQISGMGGRPKI